MDKLYSSLTAILSYSGNKYLYYNHSQFFSTPKFKFMHKFTLRLSLLTFFTGICGLASFAQTNVIANSGGPNTYKQNFDTMRVTANALLPEGWRADAISTPRTLGTYGAAGSTTEFFEGANFHTNNSNGGIYNFGAGTSNIGNGDRAVGGLNTSNNPTSINVYLKLAVTGATSLQNFSVSYDIEKYRQGHISTDVKLFYSIDGSTWTPAPVFTSTFGDDGNTTVGFSPAPDASQTRHITGSIGLAAPLPVGQNLFLVWNISPTTDNNASNSTALGIDNVNITTATGGALGQYFRTRQTGDWHIPATWETSQDGVAYAYDPANVFTPNANDHTITVIHAITVTQAESADEMTVSSTGSVNISSTLSIYDGPGFDLTVNSGTIDGSGRLIIKSYQGGTSNTGTATIGTSSGTISVATTVERFVNAATTPKGAWRLLTAPLSTGAGFAGSNTVFSNWQNAGDNTKAGIGTTVTGSTYVGAGQPGTPISDNNGLDYSTPGYSLKSFDLASGNLVTVANTKLAPLFGTNNNSYFMFINGDRSAFSIRTSGGGGFANSTTLTPTGALMIGDVTLPTSTAANGFALVGNPYASHIDLDLFRQYNTTSNLKTTYYYWDPYLTGVYGVGGYVTVSYDINGVETITPEGGAAASSDETRYLQSGQAMFVQTKASAAGTASATFTENEKAPTTVNNIFRVQGASQVDNVRVNLNVLSGANKQILDGIAVSFNNNYAAGVDDYDAVKFYNVGESIAFLRDGKALSIERRPTITSSDILNINLANLLPNVNYQFEIIPSVKSNGLNAFLVDNYLKTSTPLDLTKVSNVNFTVNADVSSTGANRFYISFAKPASIVTTGKDGLSVFPNPVTSGVINLQMNNMVQGVYVVRVMNGMGQVVLTKQINHAAGNTTEQIQIGKGSKGIYQLEVVKPDNSKFSSKVMAN